MYLIHVFLEGNFGILKFWIKKNIKLKNLSVVGGVGVGLAGEGAISSWVGCGLGVMGSSGGWGGGSLGFFLSFLFQIFKMLKLFFEFLDLFEAFIKLVFLFYLSKNYYKKLYSYYS